MARVQRAEPWQESGRLDGDRVAGPSGFAAPRGTEPRDVVGGFSRAAEAAGEVLSAHLWLEDAGSVTLRIVASAGPFKPPSDPVSFGSNALSSAASRNAAVLAREFDTVVGGERRRVWRFAIPVSCAEIKGVAAIDFVGSEPDRDVLAAVAAYHRPLMAGALCTYAGLEQSRAASTMLRSARELARIVDPAALLEVLLARAIDLAHADTGSIMLVGDDGSLTIAVARGLPDDVVANARVAEGEGIAGWVLATGQPLVVEDLVEKEQGQRHGVRSAISVPLADEDGVIGVLNVGAKDFRARPDASVADALEALGRAGTVSLRTARAFDASRDMYFETLRALARAVEAHSPVPPAAAERLIAVVTDLADACGLGRKETDALRVAALMHDIGMAGVGTSAPEWERPLTTVEWGLVKMHPIIAAHALAQLPALRDVVPIVLHHHERFDGTGYVDGLAGDKIPMAARVFSVADAYVAMTSPRPYRLEMTPPEAIGVIREQAGTQFDPQVVEALVETAQKRDAWVKVWG